MTAGSELTVGRLEAHLLGSPNSLTSLAGSALAPGSAGDLESRIADAAQQAVETWTRRGLA